MRHMVFYLLIAAAFCICGCAPENGGQDATPPPGPGVALAAEATPSSSAAPAEPAPAALQSGDGQTPEDSFAVMELDDAIKKRITGKSYPADDADAKIYYDDLRYIRLLHYDFEGDVQQGELIVHKDLAKEVKEIFYELYEAKYPFASIRLVDDYDADDEASMQANNTSAFNYRLVEGTKTRSLHSYGMAIDINPLLNPYVKGERINPKNAQEYTDRSREFPGKIDRDDICYRLFTQHGWSWGGDFKSVKDYQHFSKEISR